MKCDTIHNKCGVWTVYLRFSKPSWYPFACYKLCFCVSSWKGGCGLDRGNLRQAWVTLTCCRGLEQFYIYISSSWFRMAYSFCSVLWCLSSTISSAKKLENIIYYISGAIPHDCTSDICSLYLVLYTKAAMIHMRAKLIYAFVIKLHSILSHCVFTCKLFYVLIIELSAHSFTKQLYINLSWNPLCTSQMQ